jgi:hypothetical protein
MAKNRIGVAEQRQVQISWRPSVCGSASAAAEAAEAQTESVAPEWSPEAYGYCDIIYWQGNTFSSTEVVRCHRADWKRIQDRLSRIIGDHVVTGCSYFDDLKDAVRHREQWSLKRYARTEKKIHKRYGPLDCRIAD